MDLPTVITKEFQQSLSGDKILEILKVGNQRFMSNNLLLRDISAQRERLTSAQYPIAIIVGCIDSRAPSELIFDIGLGVVFNVRIAGNVINDDVLGSIEFACKIVGAKLIVVMGHTDCSAVKAACSRTRLGNITSIMEKIEVVVDEVTSMGESLSDGVDFITEVIHRNVIHAKNEILTRSHIIKEMVDNNSIKIVSSVYNLLTGAVEFHS